MIKYLGSKRTLVPLIGALVEASESKTALDLFTGTTRVARDLKASGLQVTTVDTASYSKVFADTWICLDGASVNHSELADGLSYLNSLPGQAGYFTSKFCLEARYWQPKNGEKVDAIREAIETDYANSWLYQPLLTSLILAADKIDSTTGVQMAYLKNWSVRSHRDLKLADPELLAGNGFAYQGDAVEIAPTLPFADIAYIDPPYNQHRYYGNYHIWESLVKWDKPETYGIANKRMDVRGDANRSAFNSKLTMPQALRKLVTEVLAETIVLSYNNESWLGREELIEICSAKGSVEVIDIDFKRYVGSQIGIYNKSGAQVGVPGARRNLEHLVIAGPRHIVNKMLSVTQ